MSTNPDDLKFLAGLGWLSCTFCSTKFKREKQFFVFGCRKVACIDCAKRMYSPRTRNVNCTGCQQNVKFSLIQNKMPSHIRQMFTNPERLLEQSIHIEKFQHNLRTMARKSQETKIEEMLADIQEKRYSTQQCEKDIRTVEARLERSFELAQKVLTPERIQQLLTMSKGQLEKMSYEALLGSHRQYRRIKTSHKSRRLSVNDRRSSRDERPSKVEHRRSSRNENPAKVEHRRKSCTCHLVESRRHSRDSKRERSSSRDSKRRSSRDFNRRSSRDSKYRGG